MEIRITGRIGTFNTIDLAITLPPEVAAVFTPRIFTAGNTQPSDIMSGYLDWLEEKKRRKQDDEE